MNESAFDSDATCGARFDLLHPTDLIVLDTNVVMDWLVFLDPGCAALQAAVMAGTVHWRASSEMRAELAHVLGRGIAKAWLPDPAVLWSRWDQDCVELNDVAPASLGTRLRCTDPDDQKFIDFALGHRARWLLSHDRAVLKLARRARPLGLHILTPAAWTTQTAAARLAAADIARL